ncbi:MAG: sulfur reduction protein DsrE [Chloroflexi bacterium]|nr:sulfur reduction protein DsrE [Chloroflexota bacterium]
MAKLLVNLTSGKDNLDKASVALVVANAGIAGGQETAIFLSVEAVMLAQQGFADDLQGQGFKPLKELIDTFIEGGGMLWVCPPCANVRNVAEDNLIPGAVFAGGARLVEFLSQGAGSVSY